MHAHTASITPNSSCAVPRRHSELADWQPRWERCSGRRRRRWRLERGRGEVGGELHSSVNKVKETACQILSELSLMRRLVADRNNGFPPKKLCVCVCEGEIEMCVDKKMTLYKTLTATEVLLHPASFICCWAFYIPISFHVNTEGNSWRSRKQRSSGVKWM